MNLPPSEREEVATALWDSLNREEGLAESTDAELLAETNKRREEIRSGAVTPISHQELRQQLGL
jgi:putative addiction module component (TIGR02574 family)